MWYFTEIAEWFDKQNKQTDTILDQWVENSQYDQGVMFAAATTKAFTTIGAGFVDILRLGDGVKEGSLKGVGADALRIVAIFPVGKTAQMIKSVKGVAKAKLILDTGGPNCFWVASAKAFSQIGQKNKGKLFASVDDIAKALGMPMSNLFKIPNLQTGMAYLAQLGAKVGVVRKITNVTDINKILPRDGSVVMLAVKIMSGGLEKGRHAIYAYRDSLGRVRFFDRTVGTQFGQRVFQNIDDIAPLYGATNIVAYEAAVLANVFIKTPAQQLPILAIPILGVMAKEE
ncbi:MAG TPA: hypothetical protein EYQ43_11155 [Methyloprofundus sp.]|nr:hypothetical protein [Methyloprofundus sp.]